LRIASHCLVFSVSCSGIGIGDPICDPGGPYEACLGNCPWPTRFDGSGSSSPDGEIVSYEWGFGDGGTGTGVNPEHLYEEFGEFVVTLTVTDNANASSSCTTLTRVYCVADAPPLCEIEPSFAEIELGAEAVFDGSNSMGACTDIVAYEWNFGDGATGTGVTVAHRYREAGVFTIQLTVYDEDFWASVCQAWVEVTLPNAVEHATWGFIKSRYR
jgi:hypothetical protein